MRRLLAFVVMFAIASLNQADPSLTLAREGHWLAVRGSHIPEGEYLHDLSCYCRAGSSDADWVAHTVIPHTSQVFSLSPDGKTLRLHDTLANGVTLDHVITAGDDNVDFCERERSEDKLCAMQHFQNEVEART